MKENDNKMIQNRLKRAVETSSPDVLTNVLKHMENKQILRTDNSDVILNDNIPNERSVRVTASPNGSSEDITSPSDRSEKTTAFTGRKSRSRSWLTALVPIAAVLMIVFSFWLSLNYTTQAVVAFDVNPSIELSVNKAEKILKVSSRNSEAMTVIGDMELKGIDLDVAVNALIGSMIRHGYLSEINNSILITVNSEDETKGEQLQQRLSAEVDSLLRSFSLDSAILGQSSSDYDHFEALAEQYGISPGKAALIEQLVQADPTINYKDIAGLSINDLYLLIEARQPEIGKINIIGHASTKLISECRKQKK